MTDYSLKNKVNSIIRYSERCNLCDSKGEWREYICVRCGGYGTFENTKGEVYNRIEPTDEETARWVVSRFSGLNKISELNAHAVKKIKGSLPTCVYPSILRDSILKSQKKIKGIIAGALE
jgi:hypothetical protein